MNIGIIGSGSVGKTLAKGFAEKGYGVILGTRDPQNPRLRAWHETVPDNVSVGSYADAAYLGEVIIVATPWADGATENALRLAEPRHMQGKVILDATNPLKYENGALSLAVGWSDSGGEMVQRWLPDARVVKVFNIVGANTMTAPQLEQGTADMFIAGDDAEAKATVTKLLHEFGWGVVDAGDLSKARLLEPLALLWIDYARANQSRTHAFKLLKK